MVRVARTHRFTSAGGEEEERMKRGEIPLALLLCATAVVVLASAASPRGSYAGVYVYAMDCCILSQANMTLPAVSQCATLYNLLSKGSMIICGNSGDERVYINGGDALLNISSDYFPKKDFQCTMTGNPSFNVSLQFQLVTNFRQGVYDGNENLAQAGAIGFCDVFSVGLKTQYKEMAIN